MGIGTSALRQHGRLTGQGAGAAWKAVGTRKRVGIVRSVFRHRGQSTGRVLGSASNTEGACKGMGIKTSAVRQFSRRTDALRRRSGDEKPCNI
jgi:hypothetical protein